MPKTGAPPDGEGHEPFETMPINDVGRQRGARAQLLATPMAGSLCGGSRRSDASLTRALRQGRNEAGFAAGTSASTTLGRIGCRPWPLILIKGANAQGFAEPALAARADEAIA